MNLKAEFLSSLRVEELSDSKWRLIAPLVVRVWDEDAPNVTKKEIAVPELFETDFASVPRLPFIYEAYGDKAHRPAVVHDYLYSLGGSDQAREYADNVFRALIIADCGDADMADAMFRGVRLGGASHWNRKSNGPSPAKHGLTNR